MLSVSVTVKVERGLERRDAFSGGRVPVIITGFLIVLISRGLTATVEE